MKYKDTDCNLHYFTADKDEHYKYQCHHRKFIIMPEGINLKKFDTVVLQCNEPTAIPQLFLTITDIAEDDFLGRRIVSIE